MADDEIELRLSTTSLSHSLPKLKVDDLKKELTKRGLSTKGPKHELQERLLASLKQMDEEDDLGDVEDVIGDVEDVIEEGIEDEIEVEAEVLETEDVDDTSGLNEEDEGIEDNGDEIEIEQQKEDSQEESPVEDVQRDIVPDKKRKLAIKSKSQTKVASEEEISAVKITAPSSDVEKKDERRKRFGEPINVVDKKKARADRFGTGISISATILSGTSVTSDDLEKIKKRASRFGSISPVITTLDDKERIKKRMDRFGPITVSSTSPSVTDLQARKEQRSKKFGT